MTRIEAPFVFTATTTTSTDYIISENGCAVQVLVKVPNFTNSVTATVTVADFDDNVLWTKAAIVKNATASYGAGPDVAETGCIPVGNKYKVKCTISGAAGGTGGTVQVFLYLED